MGNKKRGSGTHGHGSSKKRRGKGSRGGRGRAGLGKKAKHKKMHAIAESHLGERGFKRPQGAEVEEETINLEQMDRNIETFLEEGSAREEGGKIIFDAEEAGYDKVLGSGQLRRNIDVRAPAFSSSAREKIEDSGNEALEPES